MGLKVAIANGNWSNPATWFGGILPREGDLVASNTYTITIDQNINVGGLTNTLQNYSSETVAMTSFTTPAGYVVESNSVQFGGGLNAFVVFDSPAPAGGNGLVHTSWYSGPWWFSYQFPSPKLITVYTVSVDGNSSLNPRDWTFEAWNGTSWVVLHTVVGASFASSTTLTYTFSNTTEYSKFRIYITNNRDSTGGNFSIAEVRMFVNAGYMQNSFAGGGFVCSSSVTINLTNVSVANGCLIGSTVLRWTGGSGVTTNLNVTSIREYNNTLLVEGTGTLNFTGTINNTLSNTSTRVIYVSGVCTFNIVGTLNPQSGSNQPEGTELIYVASAATLNITGSFISTSSAGCCVRVLGTNAVINITGDLSNTANLGYNGNQIIVSAVCTINITGNCTGRVLNSSSAGYLKIIGSITASNFNGQISVISTSASGINLFSGPFISSTYGIFPYQCTRMHLIPSTSNYFEFRDETTNGAVSPGAIAPATRMIAPAGVSDAPIPANVRFGTVYANGSLTGTLKMPNPNSVAYGVAVDNTIGAAVLTPQSVWDFAIANLNTSGSIGERLKKVATVESTGAQLSSFEF